MRNPDPDISLLGRWLCYRPHWESKSCDLPWQCAGMYSTAVGFGCQSVVLGAAYVSLCQLLFTAHCTGLEYRWIYLTWHVMWCVKLTLMVIFSVGCLCNQLCTSHHCTGSEFTWIYSTWHAILCVKLCELRCTSWVAVACPYYIIRSVYISTSGTNLD